MLRKLILTILIVVSVVAVLPVADSAARGLGRSIGMRHHHRWHSRRWWRRYHARVRRMKTANSMAAHKPVALKVKPAEMSSALTPFAAAPEAVAAPAQL